MPPLNSHTHCQVAPAQAQSKTWQKVCLPYRTDGKRNNEGTTMAIRNAGFSGKFKVTATNKIYGRLRGLWVQIPHSA